MGERGPIGDPHSRRAMERKKKLRIVTPFPSTNESNSNPQNIKSKVICPKILTGQARKRWKYLIEKLQERDALDGINQGTVMSAAIAYADAYDLREDANLLKKQREENPTDPKLTKNLLDTLRALRQTMRDLSSFESRIIRSVPDKPAPSAKSRRERLLS